MATQQTVPHSLSVVPFPAVEPITQLELTVFLSWRGRLPQHHFGGHRVTPMTIQAKVALEKQSHPERFCPFPRCLWRTAKLNHRTGDRERGGYCPRHRGVVRP